jgi:hypothetical protein
LRTCRACAAEVEGLEDTWQALGTIPVDRPDSYAMRARFDAMLAGYQEASGTSAAGQRGVLPYVSPMQKRQAGWPPVVRYAAWMSTAAAVLVLGVAIGRQTAQPEPNPADTQIAVLRDELRTMREMMTISLLQQQSASERLRGVALVDRIDSPGDQLAATLVETLMHDPNENVRLRTVETLKRFADQDVVRRGAMDAVSRPASPLVQVALIDFLLESYGRDAATAVRLLSTDPMVNEAVRMRAAQGLAQLGV